MVGRILSPLSALLVLAARLLPGGRNLRGRASEVLSGRRSLVGPGEPRTIACVRIPAGVFSESELSQRMNLEDSPEDLDASYLRQMGPKKDLAVLLRGLWSLLLDRQPTELATDSNHFNLFGVIVNNSNTEGVIATVRSVTLSHPNLLLQMLPEAPGEPGKPAHVTFVNANNFNLALERGDYMIALRESDLVLPDGIGVKLALQMAGGALRKNLNGTDLIPHLANLFREQDWPVFLLGATAPVLATAQASLERHHPGLRIVGKRDGYFKPGEEAALCEEINSSGAVALIIGMGTPRQELWARRNAGRLRIPLVLSMGGLLDFLGEKNRRAPLWMRQAGLEWTYRLVQEPGRMWRRYIIGNPLFLWRVRRWIREMKTSPSRRGRSR